jgi:hypothetical protein
MTGLSSTVGSLSSSNPPRIAALLAVRRSKLVVRVARNKLAARRVESLEKVLKLMQLHQR